MTAERRGVSKHTLARAHTHWAEPHLLRDGSRVKRAAHPILSTGSASSVSRASVRKKNAEIEEKGDKLERGRETLGTSNDSREEEREPGSHLKPFPVGGPGPSSTSILFSPPPPPSSILGSIVLSLCFPPLLGSHSRPPTSTPYWISVGTFCL